MRGGKLLALVAGVMLGGTGLWAQSAPTPGLPAPPTLRFAFEENVSLAPSIPVGQTPIGGRNIVPIVGGTFSGPGLKGKILPGGWDWQLANASGCFQVYADYMIQTDDGVVIHVLNQGLTCPNSAGAHEPLFTSPTFEAPKGKYDWLNGGVYVGTLDASQVASKMVVTLRFYKVIPQ